MNAVPSFAKATAGLLPVQGRLLLSSTLAELRMSCRAFSRCVLKALLPLFGVFGCFVLSNVSAEQPGSSAPLELELQQLEGRTLMRLHPTSQGVRYQILSSESLTEGQWRVEQEINGADGWTTAVLPWRGRAALFLSARSVPPAGFRPAGGPDGNPCPRALDAMFVVDVSHSLSADDFLQAKMAASNFVALMDLSVDRVGLISFAGDARLDQPLTHRGALVQTNILGLEPRSGTLLQPSIQLAQFNLEAGGDSVLPLMLLLSDGVINNNPAVNTNLAKQQAAAARSAGTRIITISYGTDSAGTNLMRALASGPQDFYYAPTAAEMRSLFTAIASSLCRNGTTNAPPTVELLAPRPQTFYPTLSVPVRASAMDQDGTISRLDVVANGQTIGLSAGTHLEFTWHPPAGGTYQLAAHATDDKGAVSVSAGAMIRINNGPMVSAGPDQILTMVGSTPVNATLHGTVDDSDNLPPGRILEIQWTASNGPGPVLLRPDPAAPTEATRARASFSIPGEYTLRLSASDSLLSRADELRVLVLKTNEPPRVWAGPDQIVIHPDPVYLPGAVSDDGAPVGGVISSRWEGPGGVEFGNRKATNTFARFPGPGIYPLSLRASDGAMDHGGLTATGQVTITVLPPRTPRRIQNRNQVSAGMGGMRGYFLNDLGNSEANPRPGSAELRLPDLTGEVERAYLYWHGPVDPAAPDINAAVTVNGRLVVGEDLGRARDNGWTYQDRSHLFAYSQAYRADITALVRTFGSGPYLLTNFAKGAEVEVNGVSIVAFFEDDRIENNHDFILADGNDSNESLKFHPATPVNFGLVDSVPGAVNALVLTPGGVFIGGRFISVNGPGCNGVARLKSDGSLDVGFAPVSGVEPMGDRLEDIVYEVQALVRQPDGGVILAGKFQRVEGEIRTNVARFMPDGKLDAHFNVRVDGPVQALLIDGNGRILIGGAFTTVNGVARGGLARLTSTGVLDATFGGGLTFGGGGVLALAALTNGQLIVGGAFTTINGVTRSRVGLLNPDGTLDVNFRADADGAVLAVLVRENSQVVIGGEFSHVNQQLRTGVALLDSNGVLNPGFQTDLTGTTVDPRSGVDLGLPHVVALAEHQGRILIGGKFVQVNGVPRNRIARLLDDGAIDALFNPNPGPDTALAGVGTHPDATTINALAPQSDGRILIGGCFESWNGEIAARAIVRLKSDGSVDTSFSSTDEGWAFTIPNLNYFSGEASLELHVSDGQPAKGHEANGVVIWEGRQDSPLYVNGSVWIEPAPVFSGNGKPNDTQIFAGVSVPSAFWPPERLAGLWDILAKPLPSAALHPGLSSLTLRSGWIPQGLLPEGDGFTDPDAVSLVAMLARLPVGQIRTNPVPAIRAPSDLPALAWPDHFQLRRGVGRAVLDVLGNDISPDGRLLTIIAVNAPIHGRCEIIRNGSAMLYVAAADATDQDAFTYTIMDSRGNTSKSTAAVKILGSRAPQALARGMVISGRLGGRSKTSDSEWSPKPGMEAALAHSRAAKAGKLHSFAPSNAAVSTDTNSTRGDAQYAAFYSFQAQAGERFSVILETTNFQSHLYLRDPQGELIASACHRPDPAFAGPAALELLSSNVLAHVATVTGEYIVEITTHARGESGSYVLRLDVAPPPAPKLELSVDGNTIADGDSVDLGLWPSSTPATMTLRNVGGIDLSALTIELNSVEGLVDPSVYPATGIELRPGQSTTLTWLPGKPSGAGLDSVGMAVAVATPSARLLQASLRGHLNPVGAEPPRSIHIDSPASGASFTPLSTMPIVVRVVPPDPFGFPVAVELFDLFEGRRVQIGALGWPDDAEPSMNRYTFQWRNVAEGMHQLSARARVGDFLLISEPSLIRVRRPLPNQRPLASNDVITVAVNSRNNALQLLANDTDPDLDPLRITAAAAGAGSATTDGAAVFYTPPANAAGMDGVLYEISDGRGGTARGFATIHIVASPVQIISPSELAVYRTHTPVALLARASIAAGSISRVEFLANGTRIAQAVANNNSQYAAAWIPGGAGSYTLTAVATDSAGTRLASAPVRVIVNNSGMPDSDAPPRAIISNVTENQFVRESVLEVRGTATDNDGPVTYELTVRRPSDDAVLVNGAGAGAVIEGTLGRLDLTQLRNGSYVLVLSVTEGFGESVARVPFLLDSQAKAGQLSFAEQDLSVPIGGFPITVLRSYDSLDGVSGDFGPGWTLAFHDIELEIDEIREWTFPDPDASDPEDMLPLRVGGGRNVTLTLPDGRRTTFAFSVEPGPGADGAPCFCYRAKWTPPAGVVASLTPMDSDLITYLPWQSVIQPYWNAAGLNTPLDNFDFSGFILTNADGTRFDIEAPLLGSVELPADGEGVLTRDITVRGPPRLARIIKTTGEHIEIDHAGIRHFHAGQTNHTASIHFERDPAHSDRIIAIHAPDTLDLDGRPFPGALPAVRYEYYPHEIGNGGNLMRVHRLVDRTRSPGLAYDTTLYLYADPSHPHLITSVIGTNHSNGASHEVKHRFDNSGRWIGSLDPAGRPAGLQQEPNSRRTVITDALGHASIHEYDPHGNITLTIDALGHATRRAYDSRDNVISETDSIGHRVGYACDARGNRTAVTNALGQVSQFAYDQCGRVLAAVDSRGIGVTNRYDAQGNLAARVEASGQETTFRYDERGQLISQRDALGTVTSNVYDAQGWLVETVARDSAGRRLAASRFTYDRLGRRLTEAVGYTDAAGQLRERITAHAYDDQGRLIRTTQDRGGLNLVSTQNYDPLGRMSFASDAAGRVTRYFYDLPGNCVQTVLFEADGRPLSIARVVFNALNRPLYTQDPIVVPSGFDPMQNPTTANATRHVYDPLGRVIRTERLRAVTLAPVLEGGNLALRFDGAGRVVEDDEGHESRIDGFISSTSIDYDAAGRVQSTTDAQGQTTRFEYDAAGRRTIVIDALGRITRYAYDAGGDWAAITDPMGRSVTNLYDPAGRLVTQLQSDGRSAHTLYDALGRRAGEVNAAGVTNRFGYDALGRLVAVTNAWATPDALWATYAYDELGRQTAQTDALGRVTRFDYDAMGRRVQRTLPGGQKEFFAYNASGDLISHTHFDGVVITNRYDAHHRLLSRHTASGVVLESFTYTPTGHRASMQDASGVTVFRYDSADRLTTNATPEGEIHYSYTPSGRLSRMQSSTPGGTDVHYDHNALGQLTNVLLGALTAGSVAHYAYDEVGALSAVDYANGLSHRYRYDSMGRLTNLMLSTESLAVAEFDYSLDPAGHRTNLIETISAAPNTIHRSYAWRYDSLHRLTNEVISAMDSVSYRYDLVGNRLSRHSETAVPGSQSASYGENDWLAGDLYDSNGNTATGRQAAAVPIQCRYDWANRMTNAIIGARTIALTYNADGQRVKKVVTEGSQITTTAYLVEDRNPTGYAQVLEELETRNSQPGATLRVYTYGLDLIQQSVTGPNPESPSILSYFGYDGHGSTRLLLDERAVVGAAFAYDAFGRLLSQTPNTSLQTHYLYSGEQWDPDLGLYYNRARYLNPDTGRFWSMDGYEGNSQEPLSLHKYMYAGADPIGMVDPGGNESLLDLMATMAIQYSLAAVVRPVAAQVFGAIGKAIVPRQVMEAVENGQSPDAVLLGVTGSASAGRAGLVLSGAVSVEGLISVHNLKAAAYITPSVSVTTGKSGPGGSGTAYGGLVWSAPTSRSYVGNSISVTLSGKLLPQKFLNSVANQLTANALAMASAPQALPGSFPLQENVIADLERFKSTYRSNLINNLVLTIFWEPGGQGNFGVALGWDFTGDGGPRGSGGQAQVGWSTSFQIAPSQNVNFK